MEKIYDVAIVGGGPAGVAASLGLAPEGRQVVILDAKRPGGQIVTSSKIENVFGAGIGGLTGDEFMGRTLDSVRAFGAEIRTQFRAARLGKDLETGAFTITANNHDRVNARAVVLALGSSFRRHDADGVAQYHGRGVDYGSPQYQVPKQWEGKQVGIVGGGNSAGQAALFLSQCSDCKVHIFVRRAGLGDDMSLYLLKRVERECTNIVVHSHATLKEVRGADGKMKSVLVAVGEDMAEIPLDHLLIQIGSEPQTAWLDGIVALDKRGYILTDRDIPPEKLAKDIGRAPYRYETSMPGVFAGGDVRSGNRKRMSTSVSEGTSLTEDLTIYLEEREQAIEARPHLVKVAG